MPLSEEWFSRLLLRHFSSKVLELTDTHNPDHLAPISQNQYSINFLYRGGYLTSAVGVGLVSLCVQILYPKIWCSKTRRSVLVMYSLFPQVISDCLIKMLIAWAGQKRGGRAKFPGLRSQAGTRRKREDTGGEGRSHHSGGRLWARGHEGQPVGSRSSPGGTWQVMSQGHWQGGRRNSTEGWYRPNSSA